MAAGVTTIESLAGSFDPASQLQDLVKTYRRRPVVQFGETGQRVEFGRPQLERMLPHRDPFLLVDTITQVDLAQSAVLGHRSIDTTAAYAKVDVGRLAAVALPWPAAGEVHP